MIDLYDFLENDIVTFLEIELLNQRKNLPVVSSELNIFGGADYEKEVAEALNNDDFQKAKTVVKTARREYTRLSSHSSKRIKLDEIMINLKKLIFDYAQKNKIYDDEELPLLFDKDFESQVEGLKDKKDVLKEDKKSDDEIDEDTENKDLDDEKNIDNVDLVEDEYQLPKKIDDNKTSQLSKNQIAQLSKSNSQNIFINRELSTIYEFPLDFDSLKEKQKFEQMFLTFKQKLEYEAQQKYDDLTNLKIEEQKRLLAELSRELKSQNKKAFEHLRDFLVKKFGQKYFKDVNKYKKEVLEKDKIISSLTKEKESLKKKEEWTSKDDHILIDIIQKELTLLKKLMKEKKYLEAKKVFLDVSKQALKIKTFKKEKNTILYSLKKIYDFLKTKEQVYSDIKEMVDDNSNISYNTVNDDNNLEDENNEEKLNVVEKNIEENYETNKDKDKNEKSNKIEDEKKLLELKEDDKKYMQAVISIKEKNKSNALKLLIELAKKHPNDQKIKIRLREAIQM